MITTDATLLSYQISFPEGNKAVLPPTLNDKENEVTENSLSTNEAISMPKVQISNPRNPPLYLNKSDIEKSLKPILKNIINEKRDMVLSGTFVCLTLRVFLQVAREEPVITMLKCSAVVLALGCLHPTIIGSIACLDGYRVENYNDLYSSDLNTTTNASILFSNMGQGISFLMQEVELALVPSFVLFKNVYNRAMSQTLKSIYIKHISSLEDEDERAFLFEAANIELARWDSFIAETNEIDLTMKKIRNEKEKRLSNRNILSMIGQRFIQNAKKSPCKTLAKISLIALTSLALHPLVIGLIGCLDSYRVGNTNDLYSSDPVVLSNAVNVFSNTGHLVEYSFAGIGLLTATATALFDRKEVIRETINDIYRKMIRKKSLSEKTKDFLREKRRQDLAG